MWGVAAAFCRSWCLTTKRVCVPNGVRSPMVGELKGLEMMTDLENVTESAVVSAVLERLQGWEWETRGTESTGGGCTASVVRWIAPDGRWVDVVTGVDHSAPSPSVLADAAAAGVDVGVYLYVGDAWVSGDSPDDDCGRAAVPTVVGIAEVTAAYLSEWFGGAL